jgi:hypothetical protein
MSKANATRLGEDNQPVLDLIFTEPITVRKPAINPSPAVPIRRQSRNGTPEVASALTLIRASMFLCF